MVALLYINIKVEQRILNTRNISKSIVDNVRFVGSAVLRMTEVKVRFSLIRDCQAWSKSNMQNVKLS
jgi:citrate synthase